MFFFIFSTPLTLIFDFFVQCSLVRISQSISGITSLKVIFIIPSSNRIQ